LLCAGSEALSGLDRLAPALERLALDYRFVLIDAPPLLASPDCELVIRAAGAAVAVIEADATSETEARAAARILERLDPRSVGAVVNRVTDAHPLFAGAVAAMRAIAWDAAALALRTGWTLINLRQSRRAASGEQA
jgi:cellulose biosynthesis protein BcsQ